MNDIDLYNSNLYVNKYRCFQDLLKEMEKFTQYKSQR